MYGLWIWTVVAIAGVPTGQSHGAFNTEMGYVFHTAVKSEKRCHEIAKEIGFAKNLFRGDVIERKTPYKCLKLE